MKKNLPLLISIIILIIFSFLYIFNKNYEFLVYIVFLSFFIYLIYKTDKIFNYSFLAKTGFAIWMLLHMSGGFFKIVNTRLYDLVLINLTGEPYNLLRYDQFVHFFCYLVIALFIYSIISKTSKNNIGKLGVSIITILASIGIGSINEIIEFSTVVFFNSTGVGNYINNSLDLVFNLLGSVAAVLIADKIN